MRERLPSTTRTWTLTVSPGRNSGMSFRNESASSASRVFISAVLSPRCGSSSVRTAECPGCPFRGAAAPHRSPRRSRRRSAAALYCATSSGDDAGRARPRALEQLRERHREVGGNDTATTEIYTLSLRRFRSRWSPYHYCFQVASVVGLTIIHIFGFDTRSALPLAEKCGIAFQLTNILRDIREDAGLGRIYIPGEDLRRFGVTEDDLRE